MAATNNQKERGFLVDGIRLLFDGLRKLSPQERLSIQSYRAVDLYVIVCLVVEAALAITARSAWDLGLNGQYLLLHSCASSR
jgi:hypothetical protein